MQLLKNIAVTLTVSDVFAVLNLQFKLTQVSTFDYWQTF